MSKKQVTMAQLLGKWFEFSGYDKNQHTFNLLSSEYEYHKAGERIEILLDEYDPSGVLAVIYAKGVFRKSLQDARVKLWDVVSKPEDFDVYRQAYEDFYSEDVLAAEIRYANAMQEVIEQIVGHPMLGERNLEEETRIFAESVDRVVEHLSKLNTDMYLQGGAFQPVKKFATKVFVYPTLAQCVCALEKAEDGMYLCYITIGNRADGYFGFFVKNNGNLVSFNERPDEAYSGQHQRCRNARWSESKAYEIFPYNEMMSFGEYDYKGYSNSHCIDESKLELFSFGASVYTPIVLAMLLLSNKVSANKVKGSLVYIDSLLPINLHQAQIENKNKELVVFNNSLVVSQMQSFQLGFTAADVISGAGNSKFDYGGDNAGRHYNEVGSFPEQTPDSYAQMLIDLYGDGFEVDMETLMASGSHKLMLPAGESEEESATEANVPPAEFVGTERRMQMEAYRKARKQLACYIQDKMMEEYVRFGGANAMQKWWDTLLISKKEELESICVQLYLENDVPAWAKPKDYVYGREVEQDWDWETCRTVSYHDIAVRIYPDTKYKTPSAGGIYLCPCDRYRSVGFDYEGGPKCSVWFVFSPSDWRQLEFLGNQEVPKIAKGWDKSGHPYVGNSILNAVDAVADLENPIYELNARYGRYDKANLGRNVHFDFLIGFSKRRLAALVKQAKQGKILSGAIKG